MSEPDSTTADGDADEPDLGELPWGGLPDDTSEGFLSDLQRQRLRSMILGEEFEPPTVGRFSVLRKLGEGGMGAVYAAYDEELDRKVALKFLHPAQASDEHAIHRLLREAQALARLSHPNLVPVFDVGRVEDQVYLAMELVPGQTMRDWANEGTRPWREVVERWAEVGRALVAVHDAGMVHRDVKPANVLVGEDGRARLVDFGLARGDDVHAAASDGALELTLRSGPEDGERSASGSRPSSKLAERVTQTRAVVGTPAYMAPEVRWGMPASRASDQYGLCISLYESLFGSRPPGPTEDGALMSVPDSHQIPMALRRVLSRGLAMEPGERHPSMQDLVDALERVLGRRRGRLGVGVAALVLAAGLGGLLTRATDPPPEPAPCEAVTDDLDRVWDDDARAGLRGAIVETALPYAPALAAELERGIDEHAEAWLDARRRVCEATWVQQVQSESLLDRRMACLDRQRDRLEALVSAATETDEARAPALPHAFSTLEAPEDCELASLADSRVPPPPPERRDEVARIRRALDELRVDAVLGGTRGLEQPGRALLGDAKALGYRPLVAEAELVLGYLGFLSDDRRALANLEHAEVLAETDGDDLLKEEALRLATLMSADLGADPERSRRLWARNEATLRRLGEPAVRMARSLRTRAVLELRRGDRSAAEQTVREEIARWQDEGEAFAPLEATAWRSLGNMLTGAGRLDEAERAFDEAARIDARWGGAGVARAPGVTRLGRSEQLRGALAIEAGELDEAATWLARAQAATTEAHGAQSVPTGRVHMDLADLAMRRGRLDEAVEHAEAADAAFRRFLGDHHMSRAWPLSVLGQAAFYRGRGERAVEIFADALRLQEAVLPSGHLELAVARSNLGEALVLAGRDEEAIETLEAALDELRAHLGPSHAQLSYPHHGLGEAHLRLGRPAKAREHAQRALALREVDAADPVELARTRWLLARCLHAEGRRSEALAPARAARDAFATMDESFTDEVAAIDAWLAAP